MSSAAPDPAIFEEIGREPGRRVYRVTIAAEHVAKLTAEKLAQIAQTVKLPGFRPGRIPPAVLTARYFAKARNEVVQKLAGEAIDQMLHRGEPASSLELDDASDDGPLRFRMTVNDLAELPAIDFAALKLERLTAPAAGLTSLGLNQESAGELLANDLRRRVLDQLDAAYRFPLAPSLVAHEYARISQAAEEALAAGPATKAEREAIAADLHRIAERRVRLGAVVAEMARRFEIRPTEDEIGSQRLTGETPHQTRDRLREDRLIGLILSRAQVSGRTATAEELRALADAAG